MSLQGTLKTLGITEVLEFLAARNATGQLDITTEMGTAAYLFLDGLVTEAEYSFIRERGADSAEATYYVVSELDGTFFFDEENVPSESEGAEEVSSILGRTAGIAEQWHEVEEAIPTPNHLLVRNSELDSSVTIEPEWWRVLEIIGAGQTSLQIAERLELGVLDASLTALAMSNAGLLLVEEIDPLSIEVAEIEPHVDEQTPTHREVESSDEPVAAYDDVVEEVEVAPVVESFDVSSQIATEAAAPVDAAPVEAVEQELPAIDTTPLGAPSAGEVPAFEEVSPAQPEVAYTEVHPEEIATTSPEVAAEPQPVMHEQEAPAESQPEPVPVEAIAAHDDDDGWSTNHSAAYEMTPLTAVAPSVQPEVPTPSEPQPAVEQPVAEAPQPVAAYHEPVAEVAMTPPAMPEVAPAMPQMPEAAPALPQMPEVAPAMPQMPQVPAEAHVATAVDHADLQPVTAPDVFGAVAPGVEAMPMPADIIESEYGANEASTALAGEVINDLASLTAQLENPSADANWQLDGTFVADQEVPAPSVDADPFGDLGELLGDADEEEDRGSVLKFLRRD